MRSQKRFVFRLPRKRTFTGGSTPGIVVQPRYSPGMRPSAGFAADHGSIPPPQRNPILTSPVSINSASHYAILLSGEAVFRGPSGRYAVSTFGVETVHTIVPVPLPPAEVPLHKVGTTVPILGTTVPTLPTTFRQAPHLRLRTPHPPSAHPDASSQNGLQPPPPRPPCSPRFR